jgi:hypothetical protein
MMTVDERIRQAGARLAAAPIELPDLGRMVRRRHRRRIRAAVVIGAVATFVGVGAVWLWPNTEPARVETGVADDAVPTYELDVQGAELVSDEALSPGNTDVALWADEPRQTYVSLTVRPGLAEAYPEPAGLGPMQEDTEFPAGQGRAWFSDTGDNQVRSIRMWWSRADGDVWLLSAFWYGEQPVRGTEARQALRDWALTIETGEDGSGEPSYVIGDPRMDLVASDDAGTLRSRARVWRWQDHEITLLAIENSIAAGLSNLLAHGVPERVTVDGHVGWMVDSASPAGTIIGWQLDDTSRPTWVTLSIPPELTDQAEEILATLVIVLPTDTTAEIQDDAAAYCGRPLSFSPASGWEISRAGLTAANVPLGPNSQAGAVPWDTVERLDDGDIVLFAMIFPARNANFPRQELPLSLDDAQPGGLEGQPDDVYADRLTARVNSMNVDLLVFYGGDDPAGEPPRPSEPSAATRAAAQEQLDRLVVPPSCQRSG